MKIVVLAVVLGVTVAQKQNYQNQKQNQNQNQNYQIQNQNQNNQGQNQYSDEEKYERNLERKVNTTPIPILQWNKEQEHDGTYRTSYETGNNIIAEESGYLKTLGEGEDQVESLVQQGSYSYTSPEGQLISVHYTADETGFHASGDHIPTPPPVSEEIQKGLDLIYAGIRKQQEEDAREAVLHPNQQIDRSRDNNDGKYRPS